MTKIKGVRQRGNSFLADVTIDGVRKVRTFKSQAEALTFKNNYETYFKTYLRNPTYLKLV